MLKKNSWVWIFIFTLVPFICISFFNVPVGDDFIFGDIGAKMDFFSAVSHWYINWGGRYTQEALLTMFNPISYEVQQYFWVPPLVIIIALSLSFLLLIKSVASSSLKKSDLFIVWTAILFLVFNLMPEIGETLYWISGAYTFQSGNIFTVLLVALIFQLRATKSNSKTFLLFVIVALLILLIAGTNEISMAYQFGFSILYLIFSVFFKTKKLFFPILIIIFVGIGTYFSIAAPGNFVRASVTGAMFHNIPMAMLESVIRGSFYLVFWLPSAIIVAIAVWKQLGLIANNYSGGVRTKSEFFTAFILFLVIIFAGFLPSLVATNWNPPRSVAPVFVVFLMLFFGLLIYFYSLINHQFHQLLEHPFFKNKLLITIFILALSNHHNIMNAYIDIVSLKVYKYNKEVNQVYKELAVSAKDTIYIMPLNCLPKTLPIRWPDHYNKLVNDELGTHFQKTVLMQPNR